MTEPAAMPHRMLGGTGLQVSVLSYGFWATFGAKEGLSDEAGVQQAMACLRTARNHGVNLFDNAEVYGSPRGEAELIMGEAIARLAQDDPLAWRRSDLLITTKVFWGGDGVNEKGLSRKHAIEGAVNALERLQVDYVDLIFCHRPDPLTHGNGGAGHDRYRPKRIGHSLGHLGVVCSAVYGGRVDGAQPGLGATPI